MKLGLTCISEILKDRNISFRTQTRTRFRSMERAAALVQLKDIILHNFSVTEQTIRHCAESGIYHYRMSSSVMPLVSCAETFPDFSFAQDLFQHDIFVSLRKTLHSLQEKYDFTVSTHPGQFVVLGSLNNDVILSSLRELEYHGALHDALGLPQDHSNPINIHVGSSPQNGETPEEFSLRYLENLSRASVSVRSRLTLENEDKGAWDCENLFTHFSRQIPLCYDNLHHHCNNKDGLDGIVWRKLFQQTWKTHRPVFHLSEQLTGGRRGAHADYITEEPLDYVGYDGIVEVEVKQKDRAILRLMEKL